MLTASLRWADTPDDCAEAITGLPVRVAINPE